MINTGRSQLAGGGISGTAGLIFGGRATSP